MEQKIHAQQLSWAAEQLRIDVLTAAAQFADAFAEAGSQLVICAWPLQGVNGDGAASSRVGFHIKDLCL